MRVLVVEAIKRRTPGLLFVNGAGSGRPDVVIAGREVNLVAIAIPERAQRAPFSRRRRVVAALNSVPNVDDEVGMQRVQILPDLLVDSWLSVAGAIAQD